MFESGMHRAGALVAPARCAARMLQQLWRAAAQRAAAAAIAVPHARAANEELPPDGARTLSFLHGCRAGLNPADCVPRRAITGCSKRKGPR